MAVFGAMFSYLLQALTFLQLRRRFPNIERPYRSPFGVLGASLTVIIALVTIYFQLTDPLYRQGVIGVAIWYILAIVYFAAYGRKTLVLSPEEAFAVKAPRRRGPSCSRRSNRIATKPARWSRAGASCRGTMSDSVKIISPIDGSVYAERPISSDAEIGAAVSAARAALPEWRRVPVAERGRYMLAFLDALLAMNDDIALELAWQMGRPVRYGGEKGAAGGARARHGGAGRGGAQAVHPVGEGWLPALYRARAGRHVVLVIAPWNYPYLTAINTIVPGLLAGNAIILKHAAQTLLVGERIAEAFGALACPRACSPISSCRMSRPRD